MNRKKRNLLIIILAVVLAVVIVSLYDLYRDRRGQREGTEFAGTVEAPEYNIGSRVTGTIVWLGVKEGDPVKAGQKIAKIDDREILAQLEKARADTRAQKDALGEGFANLETVNRKETTAQEDVSVNMAELDRANATLENAQREFKRIKGLAAEGVASERDLDNATRNYDEAQAGVKAAEAKIRQSEGSIRELASSAVAQKKTIQKLKSQIKASAADINFYQARLADTDILSPSNGVVAYIAFRQGEIISANQTILTMIDPSERWVRFDVEEKYAGRMGVGAMVKVSGLGSEKVFNAAVMDVGREAEFATQRDIARSKQDIRTFRVRARLEDPQGILKPGMTVEVRVP